MQQRCMQQQRLMCAAKLPSAPRVKPPAAGGLPHITHAVCGARDRFFSSKPLQEAFLVPWRQQRLRLASARPAALRRTAHVTARSAPHAGARSWLCARPAVAALGEPWRRARAAGLTLRAALRLLRLRRQDPCAARRNAGQVLNSLEVMEREGLLEATNRSFLGELGRAVRVAAVFQAGLDLCTPDADQLEHVYTRLAGHGVLDPWAMFQTLTLARCVRRNCHRALVSAQPPAVQTSPH